MIKFKFVIFLYICIFINNIFGQSCRDGFTYSNGNGCHNGPTALGTAICYSQVVRPGGQGAQTLTYYSYVITKDGETINCPAGYNLYTNSKTNFVSNSFEWKNCVYNGLSYGQVSSCSNVMGTPSESSSITFHLNNTYSRFIVSTCTITSSSTYIYFPEVSTSDSYSQQVFLECQRLGGSLEYKNFYYGDTECQIGWTGDLPACSTDIDECSSSNPPCGTSPNVICNNLPGSYECLCKEQGYAYNAVTQLCDDINECLSNPCGTSSTVECENLPGSYVCHCQNSGYKFDNSTKSCVDINECEINNGGCSNTCANTPLGSFTCSCPFGYVLLSDGKQCKCNDKICAPNHYITSTDSTFEQGGQAIFYGSFGDLHFNVSLLIGGANCSINSISSSIINCTISAGVGYKTVILTQNDIEFIGKDIYYFKPSILKCPKDCSNHGTCINGDCKCQPNFSSFDCSISTTTSNTDTSTPDQSTTVKVNNTINPNTGGTIMSNSDQQTKFEIYIKSLKELNFQNELVNEYKFENMNNWELSSSTTEQSNIYTFSQYLTGDQNKYCKIMCTIEEITDKQGKQFTFANTTFSIDFNSIKFTISISNYTYSSFLNTLQLDLLSGVNNVNDNNGKSGCNSKSTEIDTSNVDNNLKFNYVKISKNNQILSGRFINKLISDGRPTFFSTSVTNDTNSIIVSLSIPHCTECIIDPDFSILVTNDFKSKCDDNGSNRKWVIPVAIVVSVVGFAALSIAAAILYKKRSTSIKIHMTKLKGIKS